MKIGVSSYSFSKYMKASGCNYLAICDLAKEMGFDGIEFTDLMPEVSGCDAMTAAKQIREHCEKIGLEIAAHTVGANFLKDDPDAEVERVKARLSLPDIPAVLAAGDVEQYLAPSPRSAFPQVIHTERPDRFVLGLARGKVGVLCDGLPIGFLLPATLPDMLRVQEDRARHAAVATALVLLRYLALFLSLTLPALYVAVAMYHQEMIPYKLLQSVIDSKQSVPFSTAVETLGMLLSFELLQEAGIRLPDPVGQTVSVIGALIVGQSAVEAKVLSPIVIIVVAMAGIAGYAQPSQELGAAVRLWRVALVLAAVALGFYGVMAGLMLLLWRLCDMENLGVSYLSPLTDSRPGSLRRALLRRPLRKEDRK